MKSVIVGVVAALSVVVLAMAQGPTGKDNIGKDVPEFMPSATKVLSFTKTGTLNTTAIHAVRVQPAQATTMTINGTGTGWPIAQNAVQEYRVPASVNSYVFAATSSAAASPNKVYYQEQP